MELLIGAVLAIVAWMVWNGHPATGRDGEVEPRAGAAPAERDRSADGPDAGVGQRAGPGWSARCPDGHAIAAHAARPLISAAGGSSSRTTRSGSIWVTRGSGRVAGADQPHEPLDRPAGDRLDGIVDAGQRDGGVFGDTRYCRSRRWRHPRARAACASGPAQRADGQGIVGGEHGRRTARRAASAVHRPIAALDRVALRIDATDGRRSRCRLRPAPADSPRAFRDCRVDWRCR